MIKLYRYANDLLLVDLYEYNRYMLEYKTYVWISTFMGDNDKPITFDDLTNKERASLTQLIFMAEQDGEQHLQESYTTLSGCG